MRSSLRLLLPMFVLYGAACGSPPDSEEQQTANLEALDSASRDFNGDRKLDLLWHHPGNLDVVVWNTDGNLGLIGGAATNVKADPGAIAAGVGYINHLDSHRDIVWHNPTTGEVSTWLMSNMTRQRKVVASRKVLAHEGWKTVGVGDMNADGFGELVWHHAGLGMLSIWKGLSSTTTTHVPRTRGDAGWVPFGVADLNNDDIADVWWFNRESRQVSIWLMDKNMEESGQILVPTQPDRGWSPKAVIETNGDTWPDIIWQKDNTGPDARTVSVWLMHAWLPVEMRNFKQIPDPTWTIVP